VWDATLDLATLLSQAGHDEAKHQLAAWLKPMRRIHWVENMEPLRRAFLEQLGSPTEYEAHLRRYLTGPDHYADLVTLLNSQQREDEALEVAARAIRELVLARPGYWGDWASLHELLDGLRQAQTSFEWEMAAFVLAPGLDEYVALKQWSEFAAHRQHLLGLVTDTGLHCDLLLLDDDRPGLERLLRLHSKPEYAVKVGAVLPEQARPVLLKAIDEAIARGDRRGYAQAYTWAEAYRRIEDPEHFRAWLGQVLASNSRRRALREEWKALERYL
jgi:hypothetical protein